MTAQDSSPAGTQEADVALLQPRVYKATGHFLPLTGVLRGHSKHAAACRALHAPPSKEFCIWEAHCYDHDSCALGQYSVLLDLTLKGGIWEAVMLVCNGAATPAGSVVAECVVCQPGATSSDVHCTSISSHACAVTRACHIFCHCTGCDVCEGGAIAINGHSASLCSTATHRHTKRCVAT